MPVIPNIMRISAFFLVIFLTGCSTLLPLNYTDYEGKDAATVVAINPQGFVGTFYLSVYEKKGTCYDRIDRYQLASNLIPSAGRVMTAKVKPGRLMAFQQLNTIESDYDQYGKKTRFSQSYLLSQWVPFIPQPGKRYFLDAKYGAREISADYAITVHSDPARIASTFKTPPRNNWDARNRCQHLIGGS
ncbi:hypothetical protein [Pantoea sp. GD03673]|uniref:hypothetical protein n=1 Tax=Pantoea sp. GD03673 TaxID=2975364 RepID=UPI00244CF5E2|nr:hypothetical protein [Pantoea sp. GD03673]MDH2067179.1 hypothetical protein [Pantoea sp. GD03673]